MKKNKWRWIISIFFLILVPLLGVLHQIKGGGPEGSPSVDALCPFGGLETIYSLFNRGEYINRIEPLSLVLLIAIIALTLFSGRVFCGYICPFGTIQTLMNKLAKRLHIRQIKVGAKPDRMLRYLKYAVLAAVLFLTYKAGELIIRPYDPWAAFMHISAGSEVFKDFLAGSIIFAAVLGISLFIERAWCRYLCPLGAALAIISPLSIFKMSRNKTTCISCRACSRNCSAGLAVDSMEKPFKTECMSCGECVSKCPVENTLQFKWKNRGISLNKLAVITIAIVVIVIGTGVISGNVSLTRSNTEVLMQQGSLNPDNIKGYMTLQDVCSEFEISPEKLLDKLNIPRDTDLNKPMKDLTKDLSSMGIEFSPEAVREAVKEIK